MKNIFNSNKVFFLNPKTCGTYKNGGPRYKVNPDGTRTKEIDNELLEHVEMFVKGTKPPGFSEISTAKAKTDDVLTPRYYDNRWVAEFDKLKAKEKFAEITLKELVDEGILTISGGHGSPSNDQRIGSVPDVKVSDLRNLRVNINPTNLIPLPLAEKLWGGKNSGLQAWDLISPNRASSNIGEFILLLPGEENIVLTKEVYILRITKNIKGWTPFYLLWALSLKEVRLQWQRITLMQMNREDVGNRHLEIKLPVPVSKAWAEKASKPFKDYFTTLSTAKTAFYQALSGDKYKYIESVYSAVELSKEEIVEDAEQMEAVGE